MTQGYRLGVDFGGTKIEAAVLDAMGRFVDRRRVPNPGGYDQALAAVVELVAASEASSGHRFECVGVGIPGSPSPASGRIRNANSTWLNGRALGDDLEAALGRAVRLANDANCMVLSEAVDGAAAGAASVFGVIAGTGLGGGLVVDERILDGRNHVAGEWGHIPLPDARPDEDARCWCGRRNCLEVWLSGSGFQRDYQASGGEPLKAPDILASARSGDAAARAAVERLIDRFGRALGLVVNLYDPEVIVIAGGLSNAPEIVDRLSDALRPHVFSDHCDTPVRAALHGDSSGVRGAAWLWPN